MNSCAQHRGIFLAWPLLLAVLACNREPLEPQSLVLARQQFPITSASLEAQGAEASTRLCRECHAPGQFLHWTIRYRSTLSGDQPTKADLLRVIAVGVPGTKMGACTEPESVRAALTAWLHRELHIGRLARLLALRARAGEALTDAIAAEEAAQVRREFANDDRAVACPPPPKDTAASARAGAALYQGQPALCQACHGSAGRGDGSRAAELRDDAGQPAPPRDLTSGVFRGGDRPEDLFRRIKCGVGGTPMPSFAASLDDTQIWNLVHFIQSLVRR